MAGPAACYAGWCSMRPPRQSAVPHGRPYWMPHPFAAIGGCQNRVGALELRVRGRSPTPAVPGSAPRWPAPPVAPRTATCSSPVARSSSSNCYASSKPQWHNCPDLLGRNCIQHSTAGHAGCVVFARKPDGSWRICHYYQRHHIASSGTAAAHQSPPGRDVLPLLVHQVRATPSIPRGAAAGDRLQCWKTGFCSQLGHLKWKAMPFGLQGASSVTVLMCVMDTAMTRRLGGPGAGARQAGPPGRPARQRRAGRERDRASISVRGGLDGRPHLP